VARIAIDFDGTIHDPFNVKKGYKMGQPIQGAAQAISDLQKQGHEIIIFPTWADNEQRRRAIVDWLTYFGVPFDDITSVKPDADIYLDNRAIRFLDWAQATQDIQKYA
jgi:beta-phosphoglucomutase-like phosphatase (HAD superfamily)